MRLARDGHVVEPEAVLQRKVLAFARLNGWLCHHEFDSRRSTPGVPDLLMVKPPRIIYAELKSETGRLTLEQSFWLAELRRCPPVEAYVWRPSDFQEACAVLSGQRIGLEATTA